MTMRKAQSTGEPNQPIKAQALNRKQTNSFKLKQETYLEAEVPVFFRSNLE